MTSLELPKLFRLGAVAAAMLTAAAAAPAANFTAAVNASSNTRDAAGPTDASSRNGPVPTDTLSATSNVTQSAGPRQFGLAVGSGAATATAEAGLGFLDLFASASAQVSNVPASAPMVGGGSGSSSARFQDSFVVRCSGLAICADGQTGRMTVGFLVLGNAAGNGFINTTGVRYNGGYSGTAQWAAGLNVTALSSNGLVDAISWAGGQTVRESELGGSVGDYNISYPFSSFGLKTVSLDFVFGGTVFLDMLAMAAAHAGAGYDSSGSTAEASFQSVLTAGWGGILQISGAGGASLANAVSLTAFSNDTGLDYVNGQVSAVPEPGLGWTFAGGLLLLGLATRRRHRPTG